MSQETNSLASEKSLYTLHVEGAAALPLLCGRAKLSVVHREIKSGGKSNFQECLAPAAVSQNREFCASR